MKMRNSPKTPIEDRICKRGHIGAYYIPNSSLDRKYRHAARCKVCENSKDKVAGYKRKTHGLTNTVEYVAWQHMIRRCNVPTMPNFRIYGGRGIKVCDRWMGEDGFINFLNDMGKRPEKGYSLDRIDNDKGYYPDNCRWANRQIQSINQSVRLGSFSGVRGVSYHKTSGKWYAQIGINDKKVSLGYYVNIDDAISARKAAEEKYFKPILDKA